MEKGSALSCFRTQYNYYRSTVIYEPFATKVINGKYENDEHAKKVGDDLLSVEETQSKCGSQDTQGLTHAAIIT